MNSSRDPSTSNLEHSSLNNNAMRRNRGRELAKVRADDLILS